MATQNNEIPGPGPAVLIYDSACPVCRKAVDWVEAHAHPGAFEYFSCHDPALPSRFPAIPRAACLSAVHLVLPDGTLLSGGDALPEILKRLRGRRHAAAATLLALPGLRDLSRASYRAFAARRHALYRLF